jgi:cytidine deaminase
MMVKAAKKSRHHSQSHAAFLFRGGAVISYANNTSSYHAERNAINRAADSNGTTLLSVRVGKSGILRNARPCKKCWQYMKDMGVKVVLYSDENGNIQREKLH